MKEDEKQSEAVYYSALASLDELPSHQARMWAVMNWLKYVLLIEARDKTPPGADLAPVFTTLCTDTAVNVMDMPDVYVHLRGRNNCGQCPSCIAREAIKQAQAH